MLLLLHSNTATNACLMLGLVGAGAFESDMRGLLGVSSAVPTTGRTSAPYCRSVRPHSLVEKAKGWSSRSDRGTGLCCAVRQ
jgi:hypothetical protein